MNAVAASRERVSRLEGVALASLAVSLVVGWNHPDALEPAWRCAVFLVLGPALGAVAIAAMHGLTEGEWGVALRPWLGAGCRGLPWTFLLAVPCALARVSAVGTVSPRAAVFLLVRTAIVVAGLGLSARLMARSCAPPNRGPAPKWAPPFALIAVFFLTHLLADDWLTPATATPTGTAFALVWLVGQSVSALALGLLAAIRAGLDPVRRTGERRTLGLDLGTLLFAAAMTWCYVAFAQFLIMWSGNQPREVAWYVTRRAGIWNEIPALLVAMNLAAPMGVLLSRRAKNSRRALTLIAVILAGGQALYTGWIILPDASAWAAVLAVLFAVPLAAGLRHVTFPSAEATR
ncbi:MAG TPA: hypothetical protein VHD32_14455 [Candidatus Didemnitutus sp.]|nr:hypothetical protein [Candidatus Didemnitutus sp.]